MNPSIDIIIVTYNSSEHIKKLLQSIPSIEQIKKVWIVENHSEDSNMTKSIVKKYASSHPELKIYFENRKRNAGFAASCNYGASLSNADYLLFINPDTQIEEGSIQTLLEHAVSANADIIGGKVKKYGEGQHNTVVRKPNLLVGLLEFSNLGKLLKDSRGHEHFYYLDNPEVNLAQADVEVDAIGGAYLMAKATSFKKLKGFDESYFMYLEDVDLGVRANEHGMCVIYCPHSSIFHEGGASSKNPYKIRHQAWYDSRRKYYIKHFNILINILIQPIFLLDEYVTKYRNK